MELLKTLAEYQQLIPLVEKASTIRAGCVCEWSPVRAGVCDGESHDATRGHH